MILSKILYNVCWFIILSFMGVFAYISAKMEKPPYYIDEDFD